MDMELSQMIESYTQNDDLRNALYGFEEQRKFIKRPLTPRALKIILNKLDSFAEKWYDKDRYKIECVEQSIEHSWQTVVELKSFKDSEQREVVVHENRTICMDNVHTWEELIASSREWQNGQ